MKKPPKRSGRKKRGKKRSVTSPPQKNHKPLHCRLNVLPDQLWLKVRRGTSVRDALQKEGAEIEGDCGGMGKCGKCKITVVSALGTPSADEKALLDPEELSRGVRLACRTKITKDMQVDLAEDPPSLEYNQILKVGFRVPVEIDPLAEYKIVTSAPDFNNCGLADMEKIKLILGPEYRNLEASIECLLDLPAKMDQVDFKGIAVINRNRLLAFQDWDRVDSRYGIVFDLGTSTLVGKLLNLIDGQELAAISCLNSQSRHGSDVVTRLHYVKENVAGLRNLHNSLVRDLNRITAGLLEAGGLKSEDIFVAVLAGNTTMQHLLLGLPPLGIAQAPFKPVLTDGVVVDAHRIGLRLHPEAVLYIMPTISGYVGGDLISVILASGAAEEDHEIVLGIDLGTNGEVFLGNGKHMLTCSTAAGPALEGARISQGMIARTGAIEGVRIEDERLAYQVISNTKPKGLCGSGLVDLAAVLLHAGVINSEGVIETPQQDIPDFLASRVNGHGDVNSFLIVSEEESFHDRPVMLTQKDVRELQLAKGAVAAGISALLQEMGLETQDISRIYMAGALGNYVNVHSAIRIGLLPNIDPNIVTSLGNAATTGAEMVLLSKDHWRKANELRHFVRHVELSTHADFNERFVENLDFPDENVW